MITSDLLKPVRNVSLQLVTIKMVYATRVDARSVPDGPSDIRSVDAGDILDVLPFMAEELYSHGAARPYVREQSTPAPESIDTPPPTSPRKARR